MRVTTVDAFTDVPFRGNPAAVCVLDAPPDEAWMQDVAREMNLSETAFVVPRTDGDHDLRWFTPQVEVDLCGHATLASAHVLLADGVPGPVRFHTRSGVLTCESSDGLIWMDFPARPPRPLEAADDVLEALGVAPRWVGRSGTVHVAEVASAEEVRTLPVDVAAVGALDGGQLLVTARSDAPQHDFVSRYFAPGVGIDEDPVTGSAHCVLAPYWAERIGRARLVGYQASARGGVVHVEHRGDRVRLGGRAVTVLEADLKV